MLNGRVFPKGYRKLAQGKLATASAALGNDIESWCPLRELVRNRAFQRLGLFARRSLFKTARSNSIPNSTVASSKSMRLAKRGSLGEAALHLSSQLTQFRASGSKN